jgi:hypothetical protein
MTLSIVLTFCWKCHSLPTIQCKSNRFYHQATIRTVQEAALRRDVNRVRQVLNNCKNEQDLLLLITNLVTLEFSSYKIHLLLKFIVLLLKLRPLGSGNLMSILAVLFRTFSFLDNTMAKRYQRSNQTTQWLKDTKGVIRQHNG